MRADRWIISIAVMVCLSVAAVWQFGLGRQRADGTGPAAIMVPSGQEIQFLEVIQGEAGVNGLTTRFRFIAPQIGNLAGQLKFEDVEGDMKYLCETYAIPRISNLGPKPAQIVISLSDRPVEYGSSDPDVAQYFEAYRIEGTTCEWEVF